MPRAHDQEPTLDADGEQHHPAFGLVQVTRTSGGGRSLFHSDLQHNETMTLRVLDASRKRDLGRDWLHPGDVLIEVEMSLTQWGQLVSSVGMGTGTPVTLRYRPPAGSPRPERIPGIPFAPRIAANLDAVRSHTGDLLAEVKALAGDLVAALAPGTKTPVKELREKAHLLSRAAGRAPDNAAFVVESMAEAAEAVTQAATADIEAKIMAASQAAAGQGPAVADALHAGLYRPALIGRVETQQAEQAEP